MRREHRGSPLIGFVALLALCSQAFSGSVHLSWQDANAAGKVVGYKVYRSTGSDEKFTPLNDQPVSGRSFVDQKVQNGASYHYRVTAIDRQGNESEPSHSVVATVGGQAVLALSLQQLGSLVAGSPASYRVSVLNQGSAPTLSMVTVEIDLPPGLRHLSSGSEQWDCALDGLRLTCEFADDIAPGTASSFLVEFWIESWNLGASIDALVWAAGNELQIRDELSVEPDVTHALYFPYYQNTPGGFSGLALYNGSSQAADLELSAFDSSGAPIGLADNPSSLVLDPGAQRAEIGFGLFGSEAFDAGPSWLQLTGHNPQVEGFFQFGDLGLEWLDGASPARRLFGKLYFTRVADGPEELFGLPVRSVLRILNPTEAPARIRLRLHPQGDAHSEVRETERDIPAKGFLEGSVAEIFDLPRIARSSYVEVEVLEGEGVVGLARIELGDQSAVAGLLPATPGPQSLYAAHLASGPGIFTRLSLLNTTEDLREVTLNVTAEDGSLLATPVQLSLAGGELFEGDLGEIFSFDPSALMLGALLVEADQPGIAGDILIGEPGSFRFAAATPLQDSTFVEATFGHVANTEDFFTGLSLFNPHSSEAFVEVSVFDSRGLLTGESLLTLPPGHRLAGTVAELVPASQGQLGGSVKVRSSSPLVALQLFGDMDGRALSTVPPMVSQRGAEAL